MKHSYCNYGQVWCLVDFSLPISPTSTKEQLGCAFGDFVGQAAQTNLSWLIVVIAGLRWKAVSEPLETRTKVTHRFLGKVSFLL